MPAMRIAMIAPFGIRPKGTLLARMLPLARSLSLRGHQLLITAPPVQNVEDAGSTIFYDRVAVAHTAAPRLPGPAGVIEQSAALLRAALAFAPDLIHLFKPKGYGGLAALAARGLRPGLPLVLDTDDWEGWGGWNDLLPYPASARRLFAWQERDLPRRAQAVTVASRTLESLVWSMGVPPGRVFWLPNGTGGADRDPPAPIGAAAPIGAPPLSRMQERGAGGAGPGPVARSAPTLVLYTRFWELDVGELAAALAAIHNVRPEARLILVGRGENGEEGELLALARRAGFASMIDDRGWLAPGAIPAALAEATVAIAPIRDTLINRARGMAKLLELLGAGLPVVAGDVGTARDYLLQGAAGVLVPPGDPAALARAVLDLLDDPARQARLRAGAREAAERFTWANLALIAEAAYRRAFERR